MDEVITFKETFKDFINLSYMPTNKIEKITDIEVSELSIIRLDKKGCTFYRLDSGNFINIPWDWFDIFNSYIIEYQDMINILENRLKSESDEVEKFGIIFSKLISIIYNSTSKILNIELFFNYLRIIMELKTDSFINWSRKNLNKIFKPFELSTINGTIII